MRVSLMRKQTRRVGVHRVPRYTLTSNSVSSPSLPIYPIFPIIPFQKKNFDLKYLWILSFYSNSIRFTINKVIKLFKTCSLTELVFSILSLKCHRERRFNERRTDGLIKKKNSQNNQRQHIRSIETNPNIIKYSPYFSIFPFRKIQKLRNSYGDFDARMEKDAWRMVVLVSVIQ